MTSAADASGPVDRLRDLVGERFVLTDDDLTAAYRIDWTRRFAAPSAIVVRPGSTAEVAAVVAWCATHGVPIVPQGGNTGLVGGGVPLDGEVVVSTTRLVGIRSIDAAHGRLVAEAGTPLAEVQRAAAAAGWRYGVDLASRDSATIGGTVATNAGGLRVLRHGATRAQVVGLEIVTGRGEVVSTLGAPLRDNTGYHLPSLMAGSEGTLGVITAVEVRLVRPVDDVAVALVRLPSLRAAADTAEALRTRLPGAEAIELFTEVGLRLVCSSFGLPLPFPDVSGAFVLVEVGDPLDPVAALEAAIDAAAPSDVAVAESASDRARLWRYRELHTDAIATVGIPHKLDVALPPGALGEFVDRVGPVVATVDPDARIWLFGHAGESSIHVNVTGPAPDDDTVDDAVFRLAAELGGSISAEHGIGRAKLPWVDLAHGAEYLRWMTEARRGLDPSGILNPNVLVPRT